MRWEDLGEGGWACDRFDVSDDDDYMCENNS